MLLFSACDKRSATQLYQDAELLIEQDKFEPALDDLTKITEKFADNELSPKSIYRMAEIYMNKMENLDMAIEAYKRVANDYSSSSYGSKGRFMAGFLLANNTNRIDEARIEYEMFIKDYPDNELISAVEFELENLGKSIDDIPQLKDIIEPKK